MIYIIYQSGKKASREFENKLYEQIGLLYIDKNHPPNAISRTMDSINSYVTDYNLNKDYDENGDKKDEIAPKLVVKHVAVFNDSEIYALSSKSSLPFTIEYFYQCYQRVYKRRDHETLNGDSPNLINIFGIFLSNFVDLQLGENLLIHYKFDSILKLPFTMKEPKIEDKALISAFTSYCLDLKNKDKEKNLKTLINDCINKQSIHFNDTYDQLNSIADATLIKLLEIDSDRESIQIPPRKDVSFLFIYFSSYI